MLPESVAECERARRLDPEVKINTSTLNSYLYLGEYEKFLKSLPANDSVLVLFYRGFGEYYKGKLDEASKDFARAYDLAPSLLQAEVGEALNCALHHQAGKGLGILGETERRMEERGVTDPEAMYKVAEGYAVLGSTASALRVMQRSIDGGFFCYSYIASDPLLNSLRREPRFEALLTQAKQRREQFKARFFGSRNK
jgi:tetratricopeptide (TPR) repeat protein